VPETYDIFVLENVYSELVFINALRMWDICRLVSYIPDELKNIYDEILALL
jgi:hypothetical protein